MDSERKNKKQILYGIVLIPFTLVLNVNYDFSVYVVLMIMLYFISYKFTFAYKGINLLLFTGICLLFSVFLSDALISLIVLSDVEIHWAFIVSRQLLEALILFVIVKLFKNKINKLFENRNFAWVLMILQGSSLTIFYFYVQLADKAGIYDQFTLGTLAFVILEFLFLTGLFLISYFVYTNEKTVSKPNAETTIG